MRDLNRVEFSLGVDWPRVAWLVPAAGAFGAICLWQPWRPLRIFACGGAILVGMVAAVNALGQSLPDWLNQTMAPRGSVIATYPHPDVYLHAILYLATVLLAVRVAQREGSR
ncbi:MAG: hypothetical protein ACREJ2_01400 [Planctomycetota bacterium]